MRKNLENRSGAASYLAFAVDNLRATGGSVSPVGAAPGRSNPSDRDDAGDPLPAGDGRTAPRESGPKAPMNIFGVGELVGHIDPRFTELNIQTTEFVRDDGVLCYTVSGRLNGTPCHVIDVPTTRLIAIDDPTNLLLRFIRTLLPEAEREGDYVVIACKIVNPAKIEWDRGTLIGGVCTFLEGTPFAETAELEHDLVENGAIVLKWRNREED